MAENENGQEKTEEATPKKLSKAREEGQVPRSKELTTMLVLLAGVIGIITLGGDVVNAIKGVMKFNFSMSREVAFDTNLMMAQLTNTAYASVMSLLPFFSVVVVAALVGPTALGGFLFSGKALVPKFSRMDPIKGIQRIFPKLYS